MHQDSNIKDIYSVLEDMVGNTISGNYENVKALERSYEALAEKIFPEPLTGLGLMYDGCRSSCVFSFSYKPMQKELVIDAKERFNQIPKPY